MSLTASTMSPPQGLITCVKETAKEHLLSRITTQVKYEAPLRGTGWLQMRLENALLKIYKCSSFHFPTIALRDESPQGKSHVRIAIDPSLPVFPLLAHNQHTIPSMWGDQSHMQLFHLDQQCRESFCKNHHFDFFRFTQ